MTTSDFILESLRRHHRRAALVPELTIVDYGLGRGTGEPWTRRIDALMFDQLMRTAIEIKVTRADAARDDWAKVWPWRRVCHRFVYAVPAGLIDRPPVYGCGLWWVHPDGRVEVKRKTKVEHAPEPLPQHVVQRLAYRSVGMDVDKEAS